jgi:hypothetical protein
LCRSAEALRLAREKPWSMTVSVARNRIQEIDRQVYDQTFICWITW